MFRSFRVAVGALALITAACGDSDNFVQFSNATVRLVNDTDTPLSLSNAGALDSSTFVFGQSSACVFVNLSNTTKPALTVTNGGGSTILFTPGLAAGDNLLIVAFVGPAGILQFATLDDRFVVTRNSAAMRFFNGVSSTGPLVMQRNGTVLTPFVALGAASGFVNVPTDSASITFSNRSSVVLDAGQMAFPPGQNSTVLIGPPAPGTDPLRAFAVQGC